MLGRGARPTGRSGARPRSRNAQSRPRAPRSRDRRSSLDALDGVEAAHVAVVEALQEDEIIVDEAREIGLSNYLVNGPLHLGHAPLDIGGARGGRGGALG